jgi:hypothetical protein
MLRSFRLLAASALLLAVAAPLAAPLAAQNPRPAPAAPTPEIYFRAPADGATVPTTFPVAFGLRNYGVAPATVNLANTGHFHVLINVEAPAPGQLIPADSLHRHYGAGQIETTLTLAPGTYTLRVVLGDFEHKVISPALVSRPIRITVAAPR